MKSSRVGFGAMLWLLGRLAVGQMPEPVKEPAPDPAAENALRTVGPDERQSESAIYWEFAKSIEHGAILFPSRSPAAMIVIHFGDFPKWSRDRKGGVITVNFLASSLYEPEPHSPSQHLDEFVRVLPQALLEDLEKTWDRALVTARVDGDHQSIYMMDGVTYEFRGGRHTSHPYVATANSPRAGISGSMGALADALIEYCVPNDKGNRLEVKDIEEALQDVEKALKSPPPPIEPIKPPELPVAKP